MLSDNKDYVKIIANKAMCKSCNDVVISRYRHHCVPCSCGKLSVDGGLDYCKRMGDPDDYEDLSVFSDAPFEVVRLHLARGSFGKKGTEPLHWVSLRDMSNDHLISVIEYCEVNQTLNHYEFYLKEKEYRGL